MSTMLIGRAAIFLFPFYFFRFLPRFIFLLQGQPGQEDGGGVNEDPGFRSVCQKKHCWLIFFVEVVVKIISKFFFVKVVKRPFSPLLNLVASRFPLNDAGRSIVATLAARILEDPQGPELDWTWPPIGMVGRLGIDTKSCIFTS